MCSVGDENIEELETSQFMKEKPLKLFQNLCNKCKSKAPCVVLRGKDAYCKECFLTGTTHKFKALLGKHRFMRPQDRVLIYHKGGHASTALLHFLRTGCDLSTPKQLKFEPLFICVEENYNLSLEHRYDILKCLEQQVKKDNFAVYFISLADYVANSVEIDDLIKSDFHKLRLEGENLSEIDNICNKDDVTAKEQILHVLRHRLLVNAAKYLKCKYIFVPDIAVDVASNLLTNISLGRGAQLPLDIGVCDSRDPDVTIIKPLRAFEIKELGFYNIFNELNPVTVLLPKQQLHKSVQSLMKKFVTDLQVNYPATITTVMRTGDKLVMDKNLNHITCSFCKAPKEYKATSLNSQEATNFSHWISTYKFNADLPQTERYEELLKSFENLSTSNYCFSCNRIVRCKEDS